MFAAANLTHYFRRLMSTRSLFIALVSLALTALSHNARAEGNAIRGYVKGTNGKGVAGAEVRAERIDAKGPMVVATTNGKGDYTFTNLTPGAYKVTAVINKVPRSVASIRTRTTGFVRVDFDLNAKAKVVGKKRMVWVPGETGTHIGGGHWESVDDSNTGQGASSMERVQGTVLTTPGNGLNQAGGVSGPGR